jgi:hypothetical protein
MNKINAGEYVSVKHGCFSCLSVNFESLHQWTDFPWQVMFYQQPAMEMVSNNTKAGCKGHVRSRENCPISPKIRCVDLLIRDTKGYREFYQSGSDKITEFNNWQWFFGLVFWYWYLIKINNCWYYSSSKRLKKKKREKMVIVVFFLTKSAPSNKGYDFFLHYGQPSSPMTHQRKHFIDFSS